MQAIIPVAGVGTRLKPHTHTEPKALLHVAGKTIIEHIMGRLIQAGVKDYVFIIGYLGDKIKEFISKRYSNYKLTFIEQEERKGLGHAIYLTKDYVHEDSIIVFGDTIFNVDLRNSFKSGYDAVLGVKYVDDPRRFGVVEIEKDLIIKLIEKPNYIKRMPALVGVNYIKNFKALFDSLKYIIENNIKTRGEFQLTDALEHMVEEGAKLTTFPVEDWFDCGIPQTLLETNKYMLEHDNDKTFGTTTNSVIIYPVFIGGNTKIRNSVIGPFVSIAEDAVIENSIIKNSIINNKTEIHDSTLTDSIIGSNVRLSGRLNKVNLGDDSNIEL